MNDKTENRQVKFFGHVMRKEEMENLVTTGYVEGKRAQGRQRETYPTYLQKMKEKMPIELIHLTRDRGVWSELSNSSLRQHDMAPLVSANARFYSAFLNKITKYDRRNRELNHGPEDYQSMTLRTGPTCLQQETLKPNILNFKYYSSP